MHLTPVPAYSYTIGLYAAFLARTLKFSSISQYLGIIGLLHKDFGLPNPLSGNWYISSLLTGIKRLLGNERQQKLPITPALLLRIYRVLNPAYSVDASFWAICLVAFYGMFRKSHLLVKGLNRFDAARQFLKSDFRFLPWGIIVLVRWSKTIQFRERCVSIPLPRLPGSPLCPVSAILHAFSFTCAAPPYSQAFCWVHPQTVRFQAFTYPFFMSKLKGVLGRIGVDSSSYGSHSFRRGGASFAFESGVPIELIKVMGDWKSDAVLLYLTVPLNLRIHATKMIAHNLQNHLH